MERAEFFLMTNLKPRVQIYGRDTRGPKPSHFHYSISRKPFFIV
jgi:hypothetical protein